MDKQNRRRATRRILRASKPVVETIEVQPKAVPNQVENHSPKPYTRRPAFITASQIPPR